MIVVDLNQIMYSTVLSMAARKVDIEIGMVRHIALDVIRSIRSKFKHEYGQIVIASDSHTYWRRDYFPFYKARRKEKRDESALDWKHIFSCMDTVKKELREFMPYKYIEVDGAEADDIIAVLVQNYNHEDILIVSGDRDYLQLQKYDHVTQYDVVKKRHLKTDDPYQVLAEHIIRGDSNDGIPNVLSEDNCLALRIKQRKITAKVLDHWLVLLGLPEDQKSEKLGSDEYRRYVRNRNLIDLTRIPGPIQTTIIDAFEASKPDRSKLMKYFMANKLKQHLESLNEF